MQSACALSLLSLRVCVCMADVLSPVAFTYAGGHDIVRAPSDKLASVVGVQYVACGVCGVCGVRNPLLDLMQG